MLIKKNVRPLEFRSACANGSFSSHTSGYCPGFIQANLVVLPLQYTNDFEIFCHKNPKPCPILEKIGPGEFYTDNLAIRADLRKVIPLYRVFENGVLVKEVTDISMLYQKNFVFFLTGCSYSFENALIAAGIEIPHLTQGKNVAMYKTSIDLSPQGPFKGKMVVSMRPIKKDRVDEAIEITSHFPKMHGAPVQVGDPEKIGIMNLEKVDYGDSIPINPDQVPVFWACGVTPQNVLLEAKLPFAITHAPGHMFVGDLNDSDFYEEK